MLWFHDVSLFSEVRQLWEIPDGCAFLDSSPGQRKACFSFSGNLAGLWWPWLTECGWKWCPGGPWLAFKRTGSSHIDPEAWTFVSGVQLLCWRYHLEMPWIWGVGEGPAWTPGPQICELQWNDCYLKPLSLGRVCYAVMHNWTISGWTNLARDLTLISGNDCFCKKLNWHNSLRCCD